MTNKTFLLKDQSELPDSYKMTIKYITGDTEELEAASHFYWEEAKILEVWGKNNLLSWIPMCNIKRLEFDKDFTKVYEISRKLKKDDNRQKN